MAGRNLKDLLDFPDQPGVSHDTADAFPSAPLQPPAGLPGSYLSPILPPSGTYLDPNELTKLLSNRENSYSNGLELLKEKMVPALLGHDYVPPYANFNDTQTYDQNDRNVAQGHWGYGFLKNLEGEMQNNLQRPQPSGPAGYDIGYNGNDKT